MPRVLVLTGTLTANRESEVAADGMGKVLSTHVERGDQVKAGALLAKLDGSSAALSRAEASAQVSVARAQSENAKLECARAETLFAQRAISRAEYDRLRTSCETANFSADAAFARQRLTEKNLGDSVIRAPFAGLIVERNVTMGEYVQPGRTIVKLVEVNPLRLELTVPESAVSAITTESTVSFKVAAYPEIFQAKVRYVGPVVRRSSRDLVVEALVDNSDGRLRPGMFATSNLALGARELPAIPESALVGKQTSARAFVIKNGLLEERVVQAGDRDGGNVAILKGLAIGEQVVLNPTTNLKDGTRVSTN
jgi:membrane fusion protein (multidrug efflux system)